MNPAILALIKRFTPAIKEKAEPAIAAMLTEVVDGVELREGEESACITISQYEGDWYAYVVAMSEENQVKRIISYHRLDQLIERVIESINKL